MKVTGTPANLVRAFDDQFVTLYKDGVEVTYGFIRCDVLSSQGFEISCNGIRHYVYFDDFDEMAVDAVYG